MQLKINDIRLDGGTQPRAMTSEAIVFSYAEDLLNGDKFPDVVIYYDGVDYWIADGYHRVLAHKKANLDVINADVRQGTRRDAIFHSVGANAQHGYRRSNDDKRRAVLRLLNDPLWGNWSDHAIARSCRVSHPFVGKLRSQLTGNVTSGQRVYIDKEGNKRVMDTTKIGSTPDTVPALPDTVPEFVANAVASGRLSIEHGIEASALINEANDPVKNICWDWDVVHPDTIKAITRLHINGSDTFSEIQLSGQIQIGDEGEAVQITAGPVAIERAIAKKASIHRQMAHEATNKDKLHVELWLNEAEQVIFGRIKNLMSTDDPEIALKKLMRERIQFEKDAKNRVGVKVIEFQQSMDG